MQKAFAVINPFIVSHAKLSILFLLLFFGSALAQAQVCVNLNLSLPPSQRISPIYWAPGHSYTVTLTDPNGEFYALGPPPNTALFIFNQSQYTGPFTYQEDPYVTVTTPTYLSPTQASFGVTVGTAAPTEYDGYTFACYQTGFYGASGAIQITPCAVSVTPTLTSGSVQPGTWTAGVATNITITGTGFIPTTNPNNCVATSLYISAGTESVSITNLTVVSATQITATVQPLITDPAETAIVTASNYQYNNPSVPLTASTTAQIVPTTCTLPHISSVSPNVWLAGQTSGKVTITGTNFTTSSKATKTCPATTVSVTTPSGASVALGAVTVSSATQITIASAKPPASETNENATVTAGGAATYSTHIENPLPSITTLQYTNSQALWMDRAGDSAPVAMPNTVWTQSASFPSVFKSADKINATATFGITPLTVALSGARIEGSVDSLGLLVASGVNIPAGATSITVNLTGNTAFPSSTTAHYSPLGVTWNFSPAGQACSSGRSVCEGAGSTSSEIYVTLAAPSGLSESVMPLTAVVLAIGNGGATTQTTAFQSTWQQFAGPANVYGWDGRPLYYYEPGVGFKGCATSSVGLLTSATGSGQCGSWANLLMDALAVNGIMSSFTQIQPTDQSWMLVNSWTFGTGSSLYPAPYHWNLALPIESGGSPGMVPVAPGSVFGDLTSLSTLPGQNTAPPSEKVFTKHFIVQVPSSLGAGYYDPSYGVTYLNNCDFESKAVAAYALPESTTASTVNFEVRQASGCNITFTTLFTN